MGRAVALDEGLGQEGPSSRRIWLAAGFISLPAGGLRTSGPRWLLGGDHAQFLTMWASP